MLLEVLLEVLLVRILARPPPWRRLAPLEVALARPPPWRASWRARRHGGVLLRCGILAAMLFCGILAAMLLLVAAGAHESQYGTPFSAAANDAAFAA